MTATFMASSRFQALRHEHTDEQRAHGLRGAIKLDLPQVTCVIRGLCRRKPYRAKGIYEAPDFGHVLCES